MQNEIKNIISFSKNLVILYVEDNEAARKSTHIMLKEFFGDIIIGVNGVDGLAKFKQNRIDLIITDINMPKLNGIDMISQIREIDYEIPILILTAYNETDYFIETIQQGIDGYLLKPIEFQQFIKVIIKVIKSLKIKEENSKYKKSLEKMVLEQTKKYEEEKKRAENALEVKTNFLSNMTHEMKTPIHHIMGFSQLIEETTITQKQKEYIESINFGATTLLGFINNVLDSSRLEYGKWKISESHQKTYNFFTELKNFFEPEVLKKNLQFHIEFKTELPKVIKIDAPKVRQIMIHLIENAIKFTDKGHIELKVETQKIDSRNLNLIFSIKDTGIGIPKESHQKIFQQFEQEIGQYSQSYKGTGLGLFICKDLCKIMNGDITVKSEVDIGSTFEVTLKNIEYYQR